LGTTPTNSQVANQLNVTLAEYEKQRTHIDRFKIDKLDDDDGDPFDGLVGSNENPLALLEDEQVKGVITNSISELNDRKRLVLNLYYVEELNLKEIGSVIGVKESRVSQILSSIVKELHDAVAKNI
jgi:RNA polymerase sigma factor for flagellar operon FliA